MARDSSGAKNQPQYANTGTPADAADLSEIANFAAAVGNRKVGTSGERTALGGADVWAGLVFSETDTGIDYRYNGTGWDFHLRIPSPWVTPALTAGWASGGTPWFPFRYRLNAINEVEFEGQLTPRAGYTTSEAFFTFPTGFRPTSLLQLPCSINSSATPQLAGVQVAASGALTLAPTGATAVQLGHLTFPTN